MTEAAVAPTSNRDLLATEQAYGSDPLAVRESNHYREEYIMSFVSKWDELIDWDARASSEGQFFIDVLRARGKKAVLDVATGTGFHSVRLREAGFSVASADGSAAMLAKAFENGQARGLILNTVQADWRWLNRDIHGKYDAIICLGNSFTHLHEERDRRRALAEFYAALKHDGILILDQRNYDTIMDRGFTSQHKYYYAGEKVSAEPEYIDEGLARFKYTFPDGSEYHLNMCPIRKNYVRKLLFEAGFSQVRTYGDFQETYQDDDPDFFIHIADKRWSDSAGSDGGREGEISQTTESYYDSQDADNFYMTIWGGEDIHVGLYDEDRDIKNASRRTIEKMVDILGGLDAATSLLDIGAGYGGSARYFARTYGMDVTCLNISETQNHHNRRLNQEQGLSDKITVKHGAFEAIPEPDDSFDVVWCQDAILHSDERITVFEEVYRVLKPGGQLIFTDPMQADDCPPGVLQPIYDRLSLHSMGSFRFYREVAGTVGFEVLDQIDMTGHLRTHYARVREELIADYERLAETTSKNYLDKMIVGLEHWVKGADAGHLAWGIQRFRKPV